MFEHVASRVVGDKLRTGQEGCCGTGCGAGCWL